MLEKVALFAAAACAALFLSGRGDGMPAEEPHAIDRIGKSANTLLVSDLLLSTNVRDIRVQSDCAGTACEMSAPGLETVIISLADLVDGAAGEWPSAAETHRNVSLAREVGIGAADSLFGAGEAYAGWLDHNFFLVGHVSLTDADLGTFRFPMGISVGRATGSNPVRGSAIWSAWTRTRRGSVRSAGTPTLSSAVSPTRSSPSCSPTSGMSTSADRGRP